MFKNHQKTATKLHHFRASKYHKKTMQLLPLSMMYHGVKKALVDFTMKRKRRTWNLKYRILMDNTNFVFGPIMS